MLKVLTTVLISLILAPTLGQAQTKLSVYLDPEFSQTLKDRAKDNNLRGVGVGLEAFLKTKTHFSPLLNIIDDFVFLNDKVYRTNNNGTEIESIENVLNIFVGTSYAPIDNFYMSFSGGPSFINGQILIGVKPAIGFFISNSKRLKVKISYTNIFNRNSGEKQNYSSLSFAVGLKLF